MRLLELLAMLGAVQGVLLLLLIVLRFRGRASVPFALLLLTFSIRLGSIPSWRPEALLAGPWLLPVVGPLPLLFGPLVLWCVHGIVRGEPAQPWRPAVLPRHLLHAVPWLVETVVLVVIVFTGGERDYPQLVATLFSESAPWWMPVRHAIKVIQGGAYAVASAVMVFGREGRSAERNRRLWARAVVMAPLASLLAFVVVAVQPATAAYPVESAVSPFVIPAAVMMATVYLFGMLVLIAPGVLGFERSGGARGRPADFTDEEMQRIAAEVAEQLDAGIYRDPNLTLGALARKIGVHPNRLSLVINRAFGRNFSQLVHGRRLEFFLDRVDTGGLDRHSILELAIDAGFASKTTFNRVFKANYGVTPSEFVAVGGTSGEGAKV